jgi:hypothetical protein
MDVLRKMARSFGATGEAADHRHYWKEKLWEPIHRAR